MVIILSNKDLVKYVEIGAPDYFNKNMTTYIDYKINLLDNDDDFYANGIATDDHRCMWYRLPVLISQRAAACYCKT